MQDPVDSCPSEIKQRLAGLLSSTGAVKISDRKEFRLASGEMSDHYFDLRLLCGHPDGIAAVAHAFYEQIKQLSVDGKTKDIRSVGGLESGSISIATAISFLSGQKHVSSSLSSFFVRKSRKEHGTKKLIEGTIRSPVVVVDDVITSGGSALAAVKAVRDAGYECDNIFAIIFRGTTQQEKEIREHAQLHYVFGTSDILNMSK